MTLSKKIVLLEDNAFLADVIKQKLELSGAKVLVYGNGLEGLTAIRTEKPDLILLDILMPIMNGYEVLRVLQSENISSTVPVIVISNSGQPIEIEQIKKLGVRDYIIKANFEPKEVVEKVYEVLGINPQATSVAAPSTPVAPAPLNEKPALRVLVIEDDPLLRTILSTKLDQEQCPYMFSSDGDGAYELAQQFSPDVIVLDLMLPHKNGFEVLAQLKADPKLAPIPVIVFSNKSSAEDKAEAAKLGAADFLVKALTDLSQLVALLRDIVTKKS